CIATVPQTNIVISLFYTYPTSTAIYTLSLHDALPISFAPAVRRQRCGHKNCKLYLDTACPGAILTPEVDFSSPGGCHMLHCRSITRFGALIVLAAGCRTSRAYDRSNDPGGRPMSPTTTGSLIITGRALSVDPSRTVLDVIRPAMPQLRL